MSGSVPTPPGWQAMTFADVVVQGEDAIVGGPFGSSLTTADYVDAGVPVIRGSNLAGEECRFVDDGFVYVSAEKAEELARNTACPGDMIFTQRGTLGQVAVIPRVARFARYIVSQSQMRVRVREDQFLPRFLYWYYRSPGAIRYLESRTLATGVPHINLGILKEFPVMAPNLPEQRRIAAILDEADALRRKRREALALLDDLLRATFLDMFGDPVTNPKGWSTPTIAEFCATGSGGTPARDKAERYYGGTIPWVKSGELRESIILASEESITEDAMRESSVKWIPSGALLVAMYGATVGRIAQLGIRATSNQAVCHVVPDPKRAHPDFMFVALQTQVPAWLEQRVGGAQPNISQGIIRDTKVPLPPYVEQMKFVNFIEEYRGERARLAEHGNHVERLFSSLLHRAFSGSL